MTPPTNERGEQVRVRDWSLHLYHVDRCPVERDLRPGWRAYAEHASGAAVPAGGPRVPCSYREARETFDRLMEAVR